MRTQISRKPLFFVLVVGAFCTASVVLGLAAHALSKGQAHQPAVAIAKVSTTDAKPAQAIVQDRATSSEDATVAPDSWKRWPALTDF
jgi:hypothetical protein